MVASGQDGHAYAREIEKLLPLLVFIQANLDRDLSLEALARRVRLSPFHFHRLFRSVVGETVKQYTHRLRLERAANLLIVREATILEVALDSGFGNHETFSRAFRRRFEVTPAAYRRWARGQLAQRSLATPALDESYHHFELSQTKITHLAQLHLAFIRHVGPYEAVPDTLWQDLAKWARSKRLPPDPILLGVAQDSPGVTAPELLRFDAAMVVPESFPAKGMVGHQVLAGGDFAVTTHVGHFRTLPEAYATIVERIIRIKDYRLGGPPSIEIYRTTRVDAKQEMNHTDIYLPVLRK